MGRKNQQSSIDRLPQDIREKFQALLRDPRVTQLETTAKINAILEAEGIDERLSKSAVNRYAKKMDAVGEKIRQSREVAEMWVAKLGAQPAGQVGHLLNEMVRTLAFDAVMERAQGDEPIEPKFLKEIAIAVHRLEQASSENVKREEEIRKQERERIKEATAQAVEKEAKKQGASAATIDALRAAIMEEISG